MNVAVIQIEGWDDFKHSINSAASGVKREMNKAMSKSVNVIKNTAQSLAPYKTGTLRRSIFTDIQNSGLTGIVAQDTDIAVYGPMMEFGTKAHEILPVNKKALFWKGALNPYRRVNHPGTAPHPFMKPAFEQNVDRVTQFFADALLNVLKIAAGQRSL